MRVLRTLTSSFLVMGALFAGAMLGHYVPSYPLGKLTVEVRESPEKLDLTFPKNGMLVMPEHPIITFSVHWTK